MRKITLFLAVSFFMAIFAIKVQAVTAYPQPVKFIQPDGTSLTINLKGDERVHWALTSDGYTVMFNESGYYEYSVINNKGDMVPSGIRANDVDKRSIVDQSLLNKTNKYLFYSSSQISMMKQIWQMRDDQMKGTKAFPTTGNRALVCLLIGFTDKAFSKTQAEFNNLFNQVGYTTGGATGSVKDYYLENSYNLFNLTVTVAGPFTASNTMAYYGANDASGNDLRPRELVTEAVNLADPTVNFANFDNDGDGAVDGVYVIYAGYGEEAGASANCIWAHAWNITTVTKDGKTISKYSCSSELSGTSGTTITAIGVICHEFGHVLGAPDYYDTNYATGGQYEGTGYWDMMAAGSWNNNGITPAHHNAYTKVKIYNWASATVLSSATNVTLNNLEANSNSFYQINSTTSGEYWIMENRQLTGFDASCPGHGLMIYHVRSDIATYTTSNTINATYPQRMYPVCANATTNPGSTPASYGTISGTGCPFPGSGSKTSFTDATTPNMKSWAAANTNSPITSIVENTTTKVITFAFMGGSVTPTAPTATSVAASAISTTTATLNGTVNANNATTTVTFEYGLTTSYGSTINASPNTLTGATATSVTGALTGLTANTTYNFRVKAVNSVGTTYGSNMTFTTTSLSAPTASTVAASAIAQTTATLNGTVNANGTSTTVTFEYGLTTSYGSVANATPNTVTGSTATSVSAAITGLTASTTYNFRVKAVSTAGTTYSSNMTFTTLANVTSLTLPVTENFTTSTLPTNWTTQNTGTGITERWSMSNTANAGGAAYELKCAYQNLNPGTTRVITPAINTIGKTQLSLSFKHMFDDYGAGVTLRVQSSTDKVNWTNEAWSLASVSNTNIGPITVNTTIANNLNSTNTYIAFVVTGNLYQFDNWYIDNVSITAGTTTVIATVTTTSASAITSGGATTGGNVTADGGASVTERGVCYSTSANPTTSNSKVLSGTGTGAFTASLTGLTASTTYYVRAYAINSAGTAYGTQISFTTLPATITYCTANSTNITYEWIDYVGLGTISNTTTGSTGGYGNYTSLSTSVKPGSAYTITFSAGYASTLYTEYFKIWIDYNRNGVFTDAGELVASGSGKITGNLTASFTVPATATLGSTRLRILMSDASTTTSSCGTFTYGEVEDYTVIISTTAKSSENDSFDGEPLSDIINDFSMIYPNPAENNLNIRLAENTGATITIFNISGVEVLNTVIAGNESEIDVRGLSTGMYTILINDGCKQKFEKFIKK